MAIQSSNHAFRRVSTDEKLPLSVFNLSANHSETMRMLADNGLRPLTYQEALMRAPELIEELRGNLFYVEGMWPGESGTYAWNKSGELVEPTGNETYDQKVYVCSRDNLLYLSVNSDDFTQSVHGRFNLFCHYWVSDAATAVVGVSDVERITKKARDALTRLKRGSQK